MTTALAPTPANATPLTADDLRTVTAARRRHVLVEVQAVGLDAAGRPVCREFSGVVRWAGPDVDRVQVGDLVMGLGRGEGLAGGTAGGRTAAGGTAVGGVALPARPALLPESQVALVPVGVGPVSAAALPVAGVTAYLALEVAGRVRPGDTVLIGGTGSPLTEIAAQVARRLGADVAGLALPGTRGLRPTTSGPPTLEVDPRRPPRALRHRVSALTGRRPDVAFVAVPALAAVCRDVLAPSGRLVLPAGQGRSGLAGSVPFDVDLWVRERPELVGAALDRLRDDLATGALTPVVDIVRGLGDAARTADDITRGRVRGKAVLTCPRD